MKKPSIGIVGLGYVGSAVLNAYHRKAIPSGVYIYDIDSSKTHWNTVRCSSLNELAAQAELIYVAVPTPMMLSGECDTSIVESVIDQLSQHTSSRVLIIKSTVPPGTTERLQAKYPNHHIFFSPEFLTEANYLNDYLNQDILILGAPERTPVLLSNGVLEEQARVLEFVKKRIVVSSTTAEMFKYMANVFLATKVTFANEMFDVANTVGANWDDLQLLLTSDSRLGKTHWKVPGPDGHRGFGGSCFPKDLSALIEVANTHGVIIPLINAVQARNVLIDRPERDWEQLKGRAVVE
jgi:UDPglucose 6-dehydrogenase